MRHCYEYIKRKHRSSPHSHTVILNHPNLAVHIEYINWAVLWSSPAKSVIIADLCMSSMIDAKLGSLCWTFVSRCRLSVSHLKHCSSQWSQSSTSFIPHSLHNLSSLGTPFHLPVSICKGADPPLNVISILLWLFSCTFQHLPLRPFTNTEFKTQSLGLLPRPSTQSFSIHLHAILLSISLSCHPETPARVAQLQSCQSSTCMMKIDLKCWLGLMVFERLWRAYSQLDYITFLSIEHWSSDGKGDPILISFQLYKKSTCVQHYEWSHQWNKEIGQVHE